jgi:hypothetical protein
MLFPVDLDKYLIKIERIAKSKVSSLQAPRVNRATFVSPKLYRFVTDDNASLR